MYKVLDFSVEVTCIETTLKIMFTNFSHKVVNILIHKCK